MLKCNGLQIRSVGLRSRWAQSCERSIRDEERLRQHVMLHERRFVHPHPLRFLDLETAGYLQHKCHDEEELWFYDFGTNFIHPASLLASDTANQHVASASCLIANMSSWCQDTIFGEFASLMNNAAPIQEHPLPRWQRRQKQVFRDG